MIQNVRAPQPSSPVGVSPRFRNRAMPLRHLFRAALVMLGFLATSAFAQASPDATPADCSVFSLEGVRLRMTLAEAQAATPGLKWKRQQWREDDTGAEEWDASNGAKGRDAVVVRVSFQGGKARSIIRSYDYFDRKANPQFGTAVEPLALIAAFRERFASTGDERTSVVSSGLTSGTSTHWISAACNMTADVTHGKNFKGASTLGGPTPVLMAMLLDNAPHSAAIANDKAKVKF